MHHIFRIINVLSLAITSSTQHSWIRFDRKSEVEFKSFTSFKTVIVFCQFISLGQNWLVSIMSKTKMVSHKRDVFYWGVLKLISLLFVISIHRLVCPKFLTLSNNFSLKQQYWIKGNISFVCIWSTVRYWVKKKEHTDFLIKIYLSMELWLNIKIAGNFLSVES